MFASCSQGAALSTSSFSRRLPTAEIHPQHASTRRVCQWGALLGTCMLHESGAWASGVLLLHRAGGDSWLRRNRRMPVQRAHASEGGPRTASWVLEAKALARPARHAAASLDPHGTSRLVTEGRSESEVWPA